MTIPELVDPRGNSLRTNGRGPGRPSSASQVYLKPGLPMWRGVVAEEYLPDLKPWFKAAKVFKEMEDDIVIGALYESIKTPLLDARFTIQPASSSTKDVEAAQWLRETTIESTTLSWLDHVDDMLGGMSYGFALSEMVMDRTKRGTLDLIDLLPIGQETLQTWGEMDKFGRPKSFIQSTTSDDGRPSTAEAPMDKLLHYTFRGRKRNPMGRSLNRALYRPWYFKKNLEVLEAMGVERDVGNIPKATLSEGYMYDADDNKLKDALEGLRVDETAYLILPPGVSVEPFGSGSKVYNVREIIRDYQHLIRQRFFMDFISLGSERVGTQALAKEVTGFFSLSLGSLQRQLLEVWSSQLIPWLFKWNMLYWDGITGYPKMLWNKPGKINIQSLAQAVTTLIQARVIHWTKPLEDHLREIYEVPPISDDELKESIGFEATQLEILSAINGGGQTAQPKGVSKSTPAPSISG
jgi:hypothetical protein